MVVCMLVTKQGQTFLELLISFILVSMLAGMLMSAYVASQRGMGLQNEMAALIDKHLRLYSILRHQIQSAGFIGCGKLSDDFPIIPYQHYQLTFENSVQIQPNEMRVRYVGQPANRLIQQFSDTKTVVTSRDKQMKSGDIVIMSDCHFAEITEVKQVQVKKNSQVITLISPLKHHYDENAQLALLMINRIFLEEKQAALYLETLQHKKTMLVEGVEKIEFRYVVLKEKNLLEVFNRDLLEVVGVSAQWVLNEDKNKKPRYFFVRVS
jgi:hypothetical protein